MKKAPDRWYEVAIPTLPGCAEIAAAFIAERGHRSCEIREGETNDAIVVWIRASGEPAAYDRARELVASIPAWAAGAPCVTHVPEQTWTESWKSHFPRLRIGRRLEVLPPWQNLDDVEAGRVPIVIHPAMAFGTGHHETTYGCMQVLDQIVGAPGSRSVRTVVDVGCGTGVLAIAAVRLGASHAVAVDNDPEAVAAAVENSELNGVADRVTVLLGDGPPMDRAFDIVVANIYAETLAAMRDRLTACVEPGGRLVLSGIEASRRSVIEDSFIDDAWVATRIVEAGSWLTFCIERKVRE